MKYIQTETFLAKDKKKYSFELSIDNESSDDSVYYNILVFNDKNREVGKMKLSNTNEDKYNQVYSGKYGNIKLIEERMIADTGLEVSEKNELKIIDRETFKEFYQDFLGLENIKLKNPEDLDIFLTEVDNFLIFEKRKIKAGFNKPVVALSYLEDKNDEEKGLIDIRGLGIGKQLYIYASQWMGVNNMKVYSQDLRTNDAKNIWKHFKVNSDFNYGKDDAGDYIERKDGLIIDNSIETILKQKESKKNNNKKSFKP